LNGCLFSPFFPPTNIDPEIGDYSGDIIFEVFTDEESGDKYILYSSDGYRYDEIFIFNGAFYYQWGESGGTHCPSDAYILMGHFISTTEAEGIVRFGSNCHFGLPYKFSLELNN